jgi:hypothetical protein
LDRSNTLRSIFQTPFGAFLSTVFCLVFPAKVETLRWADRLYNELHQMSDSIRFSIHSYVKTSTRWPHPHQLKNKITNLPMLRSDFLYNTKVKIRIWINVETMRRELLMQSLLKSLPSRSASKVRKFQMLISTAKFDVAVNMFHSGPT